MAVAVVAGGALGVVADEADEMYKAVFGARARAVRATRETADDLKLADDMVAGVRNSEHLTDAMIVRLCDEAYALCNRTPSGVALAVRAMRLLAAKVPARQAVCRDRILQVLRRAYTAARGEGRPAARSALIGELESIADGLVAKKDWGAAVRYYAQAMGYVVRGTGDKARIEAKRARVRRLMNIHANIAEYQAALKTNPKDVATRAKLIHIYLVELNSPADAAKWVTAECSGELRTNVPRAVKDAAALPGDACLTMGKWYRGLADKAAMPAKAYMLARARQYYRVFLSGRTRRDVAGLRAKIALDSIDADLKRLGPPDVPAGGGATTPTPAGTGLVFSTASGSRDTNFQSRGAARVYRGQMSFTRGAVVSTAGPAVTAACKRTNELTIEATITPTDYSQTGPARIITLSSTGHLRNFTVGQEGTNLVLRLRTTSNGANGSNVQPTLCTLRPGRAHRVVITYRPGKLSCYLNGKLAMQTAKIRGDFSTWDSKQTLMFGDERDTHRYWRGRLKDVKIHSRALSPTQAARASSG